VPKPRQISRSSARLLARARSLSLSDSSLLLAVMTRLHGGVRGGGRNQTREATKKNKREGARGLKGGAAGVG